MLRSQNTFSLNWQHLLVGLFFIVMQCDARAVNVSNTWTMPQEGLNVFYRFFRDRISWFEADAVCQFHHANLVTVDNSFQFDATRDLLRELDVNDIVWIGLMRPQSSDRFMWSSNSRPLVADTGYWAESLPLMDAPLCAVIDPIRDYRWHALRCGGPETASFLCEMPVPSWADACNLKDMPNLTLQYMADTASIELIRNCQEEGLLRTMCRGKQDRERATQDLICPRERLEAQRINDITNSHFKSLQIINSIPSDNNENNDIELLPMEVNYGPHYPEELQTEKNTVQRLIEQFNVDELMQADEPSNMETVSSFYKIPGLIPKPVKKSGKKVLDYNKKANAKERPLLEGIQNIKKPLNMEDIMMGDQPLQGEPEITEKLLNEDVSNEILEPLPHIKKTNIHKEDIEKMEKEAIALKKNMQKTKEMENKKMFALRSTTTTTTTEEPKTTTSTTATTTGKPLTTNKEEMLVKEKHYDATTTTTTSISIGHPMHPQQYEQPLTLRNQQLFNEDQHQQQQQQHNIEAADNSHFIPPMLLVKSHYVPPASKHEHHTHGRHLDSTSERNQTAIEDLKETTTMKITTTTAATAAANAQILDLEKTTLKSQHISSLRPTKRGEANVEETAGDSTIKAITEQPTTDSQPQHKNLENVHFKDTPATTTRMTATTSHPVSYTNNEEDSRQTATVTLAVARDETNKNKEETQELKPPQTANTNAETTVTTKLLTTTAEKSTDKLFELETTEPAAVTTTTSTTQQQKITSKQNEKEEQEQVVETTIKIEAATQTPTEETTTKITENLKNTAVRDKDNKPALIQEEVKEVVQQQQEQEDKKETIVRTTETLGVTTTTATEIVETETESVKENLKEQSTITTLIPKTTATITTTTTPITIPTTTVAIASISLTTTTNVKPITITTATASNMPQNEVKSTETSVSSTSTTTTNIITNNNNENYNSPTSKTTTPPPRAIAKTPITTTTQTTAKNREIHATSSTTFKSPPSSTTTTTETDTERETETVTAIATEKAKAVEQAAAVAIEIATPPPLPETTTRNFLKSTTEMPFKPNRRRSLTKPETVSYMKKILG